jgi:polyhydroxyalkanoate synthase subunit PhaC
MTDGKDKAAEPGAEGVAAQATEGILGPNPFIGLRPQDVLETVGNIGGQALKQPMLVLEQQAGLARDLISVLSGNAEIAPSGGDKRFVDSAWKDNPFYRMSLQGYLAWSNALTSFVEKTGLDSLSKQRAQFVVSLLSDALSPTNTLLGNPAALKKVIDSGGASLVDGFKNLLADLTTNRGMPAQVDRTAFQLGKNLALSPGAVVFRNSVLELIQYAPATAEVRERPQVIVPPQINKFYIFDLAPGKSIVEYLVKNGFQVFIVSWRNPTAAQSDWDMDTYVAALLAACSGARHHRRRRRQFAWGVLRRHDCCGSVGPSRRDPAKARQCVDLDGSGARRH